MNDIEGHYGQSSMQCGGGRLERPSNNIKTSYHEGKVPLRPQLESLMYETLPLVYPTTSFLLLRAEEPSVVQPVLQLAAQVVAPPAYARIVVEQV